ncbi:MAG: YbaB/EbfC family nucleoid-associated protein [Phycisphaeraceae bacterium]|nr:YbaB/EbfC family nucleoid-associated protein [Phycisphaeraceae bacterium]
MFDSFKAMGQVASLLKNKEAIKEGMARVAQRLEQRRITAEAPGGVVRVVMDGKTRVQEVRVDPALLGAAAADEQERHRLERLLAGAFNAAMKRTQEAVSEEVNAEAKALGLPEMPGIGALLGGS